MRVNTSLRFLVITGVFLSAEATLAQNLFSNVRVSVAENTLKTQLVGTRNSKKPDAVNVRSEQIRNYISTDIVNDRTLIARSRSTKVPQVAVSAATPAAKRSEQFGFDEDWSIPSTQSLPSRNLVGARSTQESVFSGDVANLDRNSRLSGVPIQVPSSEASVEIPVPPPLTQMIKVPSVTRLPRAVKRAIPTVIPTVLAIPVVQPSRAISPTPNGTNFNPTVATAPSTATTESGTELIYPLMNPSRTTSRFGWRTHPLTGKRRFHSGIDIGAPKGTPVVATASGTIVSAGWNGGYGKAIIIQHNDVQQTLYGHLSEISVQPGQQIVQGTVIGLVGSTGNSTGPHLHFESRTPGANGWVAVDPSQDMQYAVDNLRRSMPYARQEIPRGL
jgi:murein DD-endopeptidase MepM/ murein hydrolase activator NlpD